MPRMRPPRSQRASTQVARQSSSRQDHQADDEPQSVTRYRQFLAGSTMPPDLRSAATGDIDSTMLQTSTNRLLLQSWLPDGGSTHTLTQKSIAHVPIPQRPKSTPDRNEEELGLHRASRATSFALSPILSPGDDHSVVGSLGSKSWLNVKPGISAGLDSPQANWLSSASANDVVPDTARSNISANWLQVPAGELLVEHSNHNLAGKMLAQARESQNTRPRRHSSPGTGHAKHKNSLPPLPLMLLPLPPISSSTSNVAVQNAPGTDQSNPQSTDNYQTSAKTLSPEPLPIFVNEARSHRSSTSTPDTPEDYPDAVTTHFSIEEVNDKVLAGVRKKSTVMQKNLPESTLHQKMKDTRQNHHGKMTRESKPSPKIKGVTAQLLAKDNENVPSEKLSGADVLIKKNKQMINKDFAPSTTPPDAPGKLARDMLENEHKHLRASRANDTPSPRRDGKESESGKSYRNNVLSSQGLLVREHLMNTRFYCGTVAESDRSANQKWCYELYFNAWKRGLVSLVVILHSALAFVELRMSFFEYSRQAEASPSSRSFPSSSSSLVQWQSANPWIQVLHFISVMVYLIDVALLSVGLTMTNLNPRWNVRNAGFMLLVALIAVDTLFTAMQVATSSFSLPLRGLLLMSQLPNTVGMLSLWARLVLNSVSILLGLLLVMVCLAAVAVVGIRNHCPYQGCLPNAAAGAYCGEMTTECQTLLTHCSNFPSALVILWNLAGGTGHMDNLAPFLDASLVFGMIYFVVSSAVCILWFRFLWFAATWHRMRDLCRQVALSERHQLMRLLSTTVSSSSKHVPVHALSQILASAWPQVTTQQVVGFLRQFYGHVHGVPSCSGGGDRHTQSVVREQVGDLAWLLQADCHYGCFLAGWLQGWFRHKAPASSNTTQHADEARTQRRVPKIASSFLHFCAVLSLLMLVVSAWLPDVGIKCRARVEEGNTSRATACSINRGLEWLDVLLCAIFCVELTSTLIFDGAIALTSSFFNMYKFLETTTEVMLLCTLFRDCVIGNTAMILRLLRVPRLLVVVYHWSTFKFLCEFAAVTLIAEAQILLLALVFMFFFSTVTWQAVVFSTVRSTGMAFEFEDLSSACYVVYLILIGEDWHVHTNAILEVVDSNSKLFGFALLFVMQFIGGHVLLFMFLIIILESWNVCCKVHAAMLSLGTCHSIHLKLAKRVDPSQDNISLLPWSSAVLCFGKNGINVHMTTDHPGMLMGSDLEECSLHLAYQCIHSCRVLTNTGILGPGCPTDAASILLHASNYMLLIDAHDADVANVWAEALDVVSRWARVEFTLYAADSDVEDCKGNVIQDPAHLSMKDHWKHRPRWIRRRCSAFDLLIHTFEDLPTTLPVTLGSPASKSLSHISQDMARSDSNASARPQLQPVSSGNEMSCRTSTTPKGTPRKFSTQSPRLTPRDSRAQRELFGPNPYTSDDGGAKEQMIAAVEIFKGLRPRDTDALAGKMLVLTARAGKKIICEGQLGSVMIRVLLGGAAVHDSRSISLRGEPPRIICVLDRGMMYGHREMFEESPGLDGISVHATSDCKYIALTKDSLLDLLETRTSLCVKLKDNALYLGTESSWITDFEQKANISADTDMSERSEYTDRTERSYAAKRGISAPPRKVKQHAACRREQGRRKVPEERRACAHSYVHASEPPTAKQVSPPSNAVVPHKECKAGAQTQLGVTLSSNGPAPVYFSAEPAVTLGKNTREGERSSSGNVVANAPDVGNRARAKQGEKHELSPPADRLLSSKTPLSCHTPAINRETEAAVLNNNVVLPPGAKVRCALQLVAPELRDDVDLTSHFESNLAAESASGGLVLDSWT